MIKHKHHIIPKHAGGSNDSSNIIELSIPEHAEAHRVLYEKYNKPEDKLAWQCLSGMLTKQEIIQELSSMAGKKGGVIGGKKSKGTKQTEEWIKKRSTFGEDNGMFGKKHTKETLLKISENTAKRILEVGIDKWQGSINLAESVKNRTKKGLMPSQQSWVCVVCGKSGIGLSNYNRWHKIRCL